MLSGKQTTKACRPHRSRTLPVATPSGSGKEAITDLLGQGVPLEDVQCLTGHAGPRTAGHYDRRQRGTRDLVEQVSV